jgi:hypothetical protein
MPLSQAKEKRAASVILPALIANCHPEAKPKDLKTFYLCLFTFAFLNARPPKPSSKTVVGSGISIIPQG